MYCSGACGDDWIDSEANCQEADADAFCKLRYCNEHAVATSHEITFATYGTPGFACMYGKHKENVKFEKFEGTWFGIENVYFTNDTRKTHGNGKVVANVQCDIGFPGKFTYLYYNLGILAI